MEKILLRHFNEDDCSVLLKYYCKDMTKQDILAMIYDWNKLVYEGKYFEIFAVVAYGEVRGFVSLFLRKEGTVSIGAEIFSGFRRQGYAFAALSVLLNYAKEKGYKKVVSEVKTTNAASVALHEKLKTENN